MFIIPFQKQSSVSNVPNQAAPAGMYCSYRSSVHNYNLEGFLHQLYQHNSCNEIMKLVSSIITDTIEEIPYHVQYIEPSDHDPIVVSQIFGVRPKAYTNQENCFSG